MDATDIKICQLLLENSRLPYDDLAGKLGLSINAVHKRVRALVDLGIIRAFIARPSLIARNAISIWIYGRSQSTRLHQAHLKLQKNDCTYWVAYAGGEFLYVGAYLHDISELASYVTFVRDEAQMIDPTVGILPSMPKRVSADDLHKIDYQIISSMHKDSRKPLADVASELHVSARTVRNRLDRLIDERLIDLTVDFYPDASNDIFSLLHLSLAPEASIAATVMSLVENFSPNFLFAVPFSNLPNQIVSFMWTNTMKQLEELRAKVETTKGINSVILNVLQIGYSFETWRDKMIPERSNQW
jgi:DNA-binding Lrp family transcriptional regulator